MYVGMIETRSFKMLLKSFHENYSDLFKKITRYKLGIIFNTCGNHVYGRYSEFKLRKARLLAYKSSWRSIFTALIARAI